MCLWAVYIHCADSDMAGGSIEYLGSIVVGHDVRWKCTEILPSRLGRPNNLIDDSIAADAVPIGRERTQKRERWKYALI